MAQSFFDSSKTLGAKVTKTARFFLLSAAIACGSQSHRTEKLERLDVSKEIVAASSAEANQLFEQMFQEQVDRSPMFQTYLGIKKDYGKWNDISPAFEEQDLEISKKNLAALTKFEEQNLDSQTALSLRLARYELENDINGYKWRLHNYPLNQMYGLHTGVPAFLQNKHTVSSKSDALAYIERIRGVKPLFAQLEKNLTERQEKQILPPKFVFEKVISASKNVIKGKPFSGKRDGTILADFRKKVAALSISKAEKQQLVADAEQALKSSVLPAYQTLISLLKKQEKAAGTDDGVWKLPSGDEFYRFALQRTTTVALDANDIHETGLSEVARIHKEMRGIMTKVAFKGDIKAFFAELKKKRFFFPNTKAGRDAYLAKARSVIEAMRQKLPGTFKTLPKATLEVKAVEPFREKTAGKAFYDGPAPDGSRPGMYYANLSDMASMPKYEIESLAYHEAIPGHHMQIAIAQELEGIPKFRRFGGYTAFSEGWGLYSERLGKDMGMYTDPYSDFGRLSMELWRACRLVVDTGIHSKRWSREKAIDYLRKNTPNDIGDIKKAIERYIVMPSQATAYKVGMLHILKLRKYAKTALGENFDIREFHDVVLTNGAVPLMVLEALVKEYVVSKKAVSS